MKKKENRVMSFRFDDHILSKIDYLMEEDKKKLAKMGIAPRTRKELIEGIIGDYYLRYITKSRDPDVMKRIEMMVNEATDIRFKDIEEKIDELLFLSIKNDLGNKVFYEYSGTMPDPESRQKTFDMIAEKGTLWDEALDDYLRQKQGQISAAASMYRRRG